MASMNALTCTADGDVHDHKGLLAMTSDRIVYEGHMGARSLRSLGAYAIYVSAEGPVRIWSNGQWSAGSEIVLVEPFVEHLVSPGRRITEILLETESISGEAIAARWKSLTPRQKHVWACRIAEAINVCRADPSALERRSFDMLFFGEQLTRRTLDPRISAVIEKISSTSEGPSYSVKELAAAVDLSASRLTHFFSEQLGTTIRRFRAWKRARMVVPIALEERNLLNLALEAGYADSTHFSHSMRSFFGIRARDLCEGSRRVTVSMQMPMLPRAWDYGQDQRFGLPA